MKQPRVEIDWLDSGLNRTNGWETKVDIISDTGLSSVKTLGILIHETDDEVFVAHSKATDIDKYYGIQVISKKNIQRMKKLRWQTDVSEPPQAESLKKANLPVDTGPTL
jgi:hypothetical protein